MRRNCRSLQRRPLQRLTAPVSGTVLTVSNDAVERAQQSPSPETGEGGGEGTGSNANNAGGSRLVYLARIRLERNTMLVDGKIVRLSPGMAASVEIKAGTRRIIEYILSPLLKMTGEAGRER
jgi:hemolysin D